MRLGGRTACCLWVVMGVAGCPPEGPKAPPLPAPQPTELVVERFNANNRRIDRPVYSRYVSVQASFRDQQGRMRQFSGDGKFLFQRPRNLYLDITHGLGVGVARFGSNETEYWGWVQAEVNEGWLGRYENLDQGRDQQMPLRPDRIIDALGMNELPTGQFGVLLWVRRCLDTPAVDEFLYVRDLGTGQGVLEREYWLSRRWPFMALAIRFTDALGRPSLQSLLSDYASIGGPDGPLAAHRMTLEVGQDEGRMTLSFGELEFRDATPLAFRRPPLSEWPVREIIDLDAEMGTEPR